MDILAHAITDPAPVISTGSLRDDLLAQFRQMADALAGPAGNAILANIGQARQHPELRAAIRERITEPRQRILRILPAAGVERGEVRPDALTPECLDAGPALLRHRFLEQGPVISDRIIVSIVDSVLIPMLRP